MEKLNTITRSSVNPHRLAMTVKGLIPLVIFIAAHFSVEIEASELDDLVTQIGLVISALITLYGLARKLFVKFR
jgi:hypothetical protein